MEKFLFIVREDLQKLSTFTEEERYMGIREMLRWVEELAQTGNYVNGEPLLATGRHVGNDFVVSDGPFIESKEGVSGYMIVTAESLDQAVSFAQSCPKLIKGELSLEIRPIFQVKTEMLG